MRAHRFLKGQDALSLAWVGPGPARALAVDGSVRALPEGGGRRDGSGQALEAPVQAIGRGIR